MLGESWHGRGHQEGVVRLGIPAGTSQKWRLRVRQAVVHTRLSYGTRTVVDALQGLLSLILT